MLLSLPGSAAFVAIGVWMFPEEPIMGTIVIGFFGLAGVALLVSLHPGTSWLEVSDAGITFCRAFRKEFTAWKDISHFYPLKIGGHAMVGWEFLPHHAELATVRKVSKSLTGTEAALPDTYGMSARKLADLLNEELETWRNRNGPVRS